MRLTFKSLLESGCRTRRELAERIEFWANRYGFRRSVDEGDDFVYERGSHWQAFYTFDIRKVPTKVTVEVVDDETGLCLCTIDCGSWLQVKTPDDDKRLSEQMDLLAACLRGIFTESLIRPVPADATSDAIRPAKVPASER